MSDLISRQDAIEAVGFYSCHSGEKLLFADNELKRLPSAQPECKTGRWIDMGDFEQCSVCTGTQLKEVQTYYGKAIWMRTPYCPNCGAKMDGEVKSNE